MSHRLLMAAVLLFAVRGYAGDADTSTVKSLNGSFE